jgi:hypothetical protein
VLDKNFYIVIALNVSPHFLEVCKINFNPTLSKWSLLQLKCFDSERVIVPCLMFDLYYYLRVRLSTANMGNN